MASLHDQKPPSSATTVLVFLGALPLVVLVGLMFVGALRTSNRPPIAQEAAIAENRANDASTPLEVPSAIAQQPVSPEKAARGIPDSFQSPNNPSQPNLKSEPISQQPLPPWQAALDSSMEPPTYAKLAFQSFD